MSIFVAILLCFVAAHPTPGRNDSIDAMPTPETPYGATWETNPSKRTRKEVKRMLENLPENNYSRMVKRRRLQEMHIESMNKKFSDNIAKFLDYDPDEVDGNSDSAKKPPLFCCLIYLCKHLHALKRNLQGKITALGGEVSANVSPSVTHVLCDAKLMDAKTRTELKDLKSKNIVTLEWLNACHNKKCRVDEKDFLCSFNDTLKEKSSNEQNLNCSRLDESEICFKPSVRMPLSFVQTEGQKFEEMTQDDNTEVEQELAELEKLAANSGSTESQEIGLMGKTPLLHKRNSIVRKSSGKKDSTEGPQPPSKMPFSLRLKIISILFTRINFFNIIYQNKFFQYYLPE